MNDLIKQMLRAAKLDVHFYEEVEADQSALRPAMLVVILSSVAAGLGVGGLSLVRLITGILFALSGWFIWAYLTFLIGTKLFPEPQTHADHGQLLRTLGFSSAPGLIRVLGVIEPLRELVFLIASIWMLAAMVIAVRQALDYRSALRATGVCFFGWIIQILVIAILLGIAGKGMAGI